MSNNLGRGAIRCEPPLSGCACRKILERIRKKCLLGFASLRGDHLTNSIGMLDSSLFGEALNDDPQ
jgi:hypothetical protein